LRVFWSPGQRPTKEVRTFRTITRDLEALRDWLKAMGVTHVGMESTGVYWRPVYTVLEGHFELIVANARHIRNVPGRKTDVKDAEWIADLVRHGLIWGIRSQAEIFSIADHVCGSCGVTATAARAASVSSMRQRPHHLISGSVAGTGP
jgi:Transposase